MYCLPYAGASAEQLYSSWQQFITNKGFLDIVPLELPGRGKRFKEQYILDFRELVNDLLNNIKEGLPNNHYAFFGHSLGGLLSYEMSHLISDCEITKPIYLFISGCDSPNEIVKKEMDLSDAGLMNVLLNYGGTSPQLLWDKELLDLYMPRLRSDFLALKSYSFVSNRKPLDIPMSVFHGSNDKTLVGETTEWARFSKGKIQYKSFNGGHCFIRQEISAVVKTIEQTLRTSLG